jgi:hypothetical protein
MEKNLTIFSVYVFLFRVCTSLWKRATAGGSLDYVVVVLGGPCEDVQDKRALTLIKIDWEHGGDL